MINISNIIAACGVLVTGIFSYLLWKANKEMANIAKATLKLSEEIVVKEENRLIEYKRIMRRQLLPKILGNTQAAYHAVVDTDSMNIYRKLKRAPESLNIDKRELAEYFSADEVGLIIRAWEIYENYRAKYFKESYSGNEIDILLEKAPIVIENFCDLENMLNDIKV